MAHPDGINKNMYLKESFYVFEQFEYSTRKLKVCPNNSKTNKIENEFTTNKIIKLF